MSPPPESTQGPFFHRPELAIALADHALDTSLGTSGGMFLAVRSSPIPITKALGSAAH